MSDFFTKDSYSYDEIMNELPKDGVFKGYFSRKIKTKAGVLKYYLYTEDWKTLVLSAINPYSRNYMVSRSSIEYDEASDSFVGQLLSNSSTNSYNAVDKNGEKKIGIEYKAIANRDRLFRQLNVVVPTQKIIKQRLPVLENGMWTLHFPEHNGIPSDKNLIIDYEEDFCFMFEKLEQDEFYFSVKWPLSIFEGFCLALSTMKKYLDE